MIPMYSDGYNQTFNSMNHEKLRDLIRSCPQLKHSMDFRIPETLIRRANLYILFISKSYLQPIFSTHRVKEIYFTLIFLYSFVSVVGFIFNLTVIVALLKHKTLINITNIYILCLALSDIVLCSFNVPMQTYYEISELANLQTNQCRLLFTSFGIPMYVSSLIILLIAIDRHQMIVHPLNKRITPLKAVFLVLIVLIFSIFSSIPVAMYTISDFVDHFKLFVNISNIPAFPKYCTESWPDNNLRLTYSITTFFILFLCPLLITSGLYVHIYNSLNTKRIYRKNETSRKKRTNKVLSLVVVMFGVCWSPWCIYSLLLEIYSYFYPILKIENTLLKILCQRILDSSSLRQISVNLSFSIANHSQTIDSVVERNQANLMDGRATKAVDMVLKLIAMGSAVVNPFLYGWLNESIRLSMMRLIHPRFLRIFWKENESCSLNTSRVNSENRTFGLTIIHRTTRRKYRNQEKSNLLSPDHKFSSESSPVFISGSPGIKSDNP
uniref:NPYR-15 n=1 Tax=Schmidtea mediterranea TaxID=79327 RepID=A0A193KUT9_SCHMD|nr:NPYR-15 [Schmidtea mediterranea]